MRPPRPELGCCTTKKSLRRRLCLRYGDLGESTLEGNVKIKNTE
jgi:hypothetical protein